MPTAMPETSQNSFDEGKRAARENIPAQGNPHPEGSEAHAQWSAGHTQVAGAIEAGESEST